MRQTYRTAVVQGPRSLELETCRLRDPLPGEVRVRLEGCGVCGSNLPVWEGRPWFKYPLPQGSPGHEGWGVVDSVGPDVKGLGAGDRVALLTQCSFSEYEYPDPESLVLLPDVLAGKPFPGEPLGCAMNVFSRSGIRRGDHVAVIGIGFLGAAVVALAANAGARVYAFSRRTSSLQAAKRAGALESFSLDDLDDARARVMEITRQDGCDCVIEATGFQGPLTFAATLCRVRGRLVIAGYHQDGPRSVDMQLWNWRGLDVINAHERDLNVYCDGVRAAAKAVADGRLDINLLLGETYTLEGMGKALDRLGARDATFGKSIILLNS